MEEGTGALSGGEPQMQTVTGGVREWQEAACRADVMFI